MPRGRRPKHTRNITGLRNQPTQLNVSQLLPNAETIANNTEPTQTPPGNSHANSNTGTYDTLSEQGLHFDSTRLMIDDDNAGIGSKEVEEASLRRRDWGDRNLQESSIALAVNEGDDEGWLPNALKKRKRPRTERPKLYAKGPDVMSKSKRTQRRYRKANQNQKTLDVFLSSVPAHIRHGGHLPVEHTVTCHSEPATVRQETIEVEIPPAMCEESVDI
ncbi:hypothetical protein M378DRAFT_25765 [Amanita muscaria Koide BX008]|uniref:Uncharacterized protein n=1 Tax=Amanita muscaria (strain Koide BX008) TaxID=946122 RepID=A0A0C2WKR3_AMAMK|nr:hypothetical protein M378DRAFT_25765 [Amanita muscaria Koide BX008]